MVEPVVTVKNTFVLSPGGTCVLTLLVASERQLVTPPPLSAIAAMNPLPPAVAEIAARCRPLYERLRAHRLRA